MYQGLWKRYVEMRNMTMKAGLADVGMKRSGSQLEMEYVSIIILRGAVGDRNGEAE